MSSVKMYWTLTQSPGATAALVVLFAALCVSTVTDLRHRKILNAVTLPAALLGLIIHGVCGGGWPLLSSLLACLLWLFAGIAVWTTGGVGAGDVKMLAAIGALVGFWPAFWTYFLSTFAMVAYLPVRWVIQGTLTENLRRLGAWLHSMVMPGVKLVHFTPAGMEDRTPHAPFFLLGAVGMKILSTYGVLPW